MKRALKPKRRPGALARIDAEALANFRGGLRRLRELGDDLGRAPTAKDLDARRGRMPSKSLYWHTFGSLTAALREAGFDGPVGEERLRRAMARGAAPPPRA